MGNCVFGGFSVAETMVKVVTTSGGIMELYAPITAECITNEFPGYGIFQSDNLFSNPLLHNEELLIGKLYYLLPLNSNLQISTPDKTNNNSNISRTCSMPSSFNTPYRMSCDHQGALRRGNSETAEVLPRYNNNGVWKVKLVISPEQLSEILSQEARTEALIESVRTVAKCGTGVSSSLANSDQWSVSSSWKASLD
ncbi:PADRE domain [Dillenia turbinata]|uniref:PADRE domain n=1 Tax=Dillenia turbinata TaxID=194707 RepID=A0AAN8YYI3_9MAGN